VSVLSFQKGLPERKQVPLRALDGSLAEKKRARHTVAQRDHERTRRLQSQKLERDSSFERIEDRMHRMCPVYRWWQGYEREQGEVLPEIRNKRATHKGKERPKQAKELSLALVRKRNETKRSKTRRDQGGATIGMQSSHRRIPKIRGFFFVSFHSPIERPQRERHSDKNWRRPFVSNRRGWDGRGMVRFLQCTKPNVDRIEASGGLVGVDDCSAILQPLPHFLRNPQTR